MDLSEQLGSGDFVEKSIRSKKRKKRSEDDAKEEEEMVRILVNLARRKPMMINNNTDISALTDHVKSPETKKRRVRQEDVSPSSHVCPQCNKSFASGQALGGHMSSHKAHNIKKSVVTLNVDLPVAIDTEVKKGFKIHIKLKKPCQESDQVANSTQVATNSPEIASSPETGN